jgi:hypothetical protein
MMTRVLVISDFTQETFGHERFVCIDRIANNGLHIKGAFHSDKWGDVRTYFNFELNDAGRIVMLDIGQVDYPSELRIRRDDQASVWLCVARRRLRLT